MRRIIRFLTYPIYKKYLEILLRLTSLEDAIDCLIDSPTWVDQEAIGFNGQLHRKQIFRDIVQTLSIEQILETGTWLGNTTGYMAMVSDLPVFTCESSPRFYALSKRRLADFTNIHFHLSDSRRFLENRAKTESIGKCVFIYLDAHWYENCPLQEELAIILAHWTSFVIMIDDFQVPGDTGYGYDDYAKDYGRGVTLNLDLIASLVRRHDLISFYPAIGSDQETGSQRGCIVLAKAGKMTEGLDKIASLRRSGS